MRRLDFDEVQMIRTIFAALLALCLYTGGASAQQQICNAVPNTLSSGQTAVANQVMGDFTYLLNCLLMLRGYLGGLTLANDPNPNQTTIDTAVGTAMSDDGNTLMSLPTAFAKNAAAAWSLGATGGCLDSGSLQMSTWYHVFVIARTDTVNGNVDIVCTASTAVPPAPGPIPNYTKKRRIGSFKTDGSSHILAFKQSGDEFIWATPIQDINVGTLGPTITTFTLPSVPSGVVVNALVRGYMYNAGTATNGVVVPFDDTGTTTSNIPVGNITLIASSTIAGGGLFGNLRTSTAQQIRAAAANTSTQFAVVTYGWIDTRGRFN